jgi:hypothetical protein
MDPCGSRELLPRSLVGQEIACSLSRCDKLSVYTTNPRHLIDNNPVELSFGYDGTEVNALGNCRAYKSLTCVFVLCSKLHGLGESITHAFENGYQNAKIMG